MYLNAKLEVSNVHWFYCECSNIAVSYSSLLGPIKIDVTYENLPIPQSPFGVNVSPGCDATRVKAYGPGLEKGFTNQPQTFTIETKGAGQGNLSLAVEGL